MPSALRRITRTSLHPSKTPTESCPACGNVIFDDDHAVRIHNEPFHARCVLYRGGPATRRGR